jgi:hypothetical protein
VQLQSTAREEEDEEDEDTAREEEEEKDEAKAREEEDKEDEDIASNVSKEDGADTEAAVEAVPGVNGIQSTTEVLLKDIRHRNVPADQSPPGPVDNALELLRNYPALSQAQEKLLLQSQDKSLDVIFRARILAMVGVLNLFLDPGLSYTWREASMIVAKAQGHGSTRARSIRAWVLGFIREWTLPLHSYKYTRQTILGDEDVLQEIQEQLSMKARSGFIKA